MEYHTNDEVITLDVSVFEGTITTNSFYMIDFDVLLRPFIEKYKYCNIELVQCSQYGFGEGPPLNFVLYGLPWVHQTNIPNLGTGRIFGGYKRPAILQPHITSRRNEIDVNDFIGQIETFSLHNIGKKELTIGGLSLTNTTFISGGLIPIRLVFKFYPVYENYIDVIYNDDNERRKIEIR